LSWIQLAVASAAVCAGAAVHGGVGFGLALVAAPLLMLIDSRLVPAPLIFSALVLTLLMAHRERDSLDISGVGFALLGHFPGTVLGAAALAIFPARGMSLLFGALVLVAVAMSASGLRVRRTLWTLVGAGALSGFMGTTVSIGGPPMALVYQHEGGPRLRGTLSGFFIVASAVSLIALRAVGRFQAYEMRSAVALVPGVLLGFIISTRLTPFLDRHHSRPAVLLVAAAGGVAVLLRQLL